MKQRVLSGMQPSGLLHLGNLMGALDNWRKLQDQYECFYFIADWHALTTNYADTSNIRTYVREMVMDWLAAGLDPEKAVLFQQSHVPEHAVLHVLLSMSTPLPWLERVPTYKEQIEQFHKTQFGRVTTRRDMRNASQASSNDGATPRLYGHSVLRLMESRSFAYALILGWTGQAPAQPFEPALVDALCRFEDDEPVRGPERAQAVVSRGARQARALGNLGRARLRSRPNPVLSRTRELQVQLELGEGG